MKKSLWLLTLVFLLSTVIFAQEDKHQPFDMLLGLNYGAGITPNIGEVFEGLSNSRVPQGNYAILFDFGLTYDFYLFNFLSFNTGLLVHPDVYVLLDQDLSGVDEFGKIAAGPVCLTIPLGAHVNIPKVEWLYAGIGLSLNIPIFGIFDEVAGFDTKGDFFVGLPIDIGFDFISPGRGGMRLFFRITPEFHENATAVPIGFIWQIYNWKIYSKK